MSKAPVLAPVEKDDKARAVSRMFSSIAPRYDLNNTLLSFGRHHAWKRAAVEQADCRPGDRVLDVGTGTADLALLLAERVGASPASSASGGGLGGGEVLAVDCNPEMLRVGLDKVRSAAPHARITCLLGDALSLPVRSGSCAVATTAFCLRNVADLPRALQEMHRVLQPGGRAVCLEFSHPKGLLLRRLYDWYSFALLPKIGTAVAGDRTGVYYYLPDSIRRFPDRDGLKALMEEAGFHEVTYTDLTGGIVSIHKGVA